MFGGRHVFRGWTNTDVAGVHRRFVPYKLGNDGKRGTRRPTRNNAGLEKLKKRARRATITSDVSRPNDRHLSRRSRYYAKSPLPFGDSARTASESYKQTTCLRFSFPVPLSPSSSCQSPSIPLSLSLSLARARVAATKPEYVGDVLRKQGQLSSPEFMNVWEFFARHCGNLWLAFSPRIIIVPASCPHRRIMQILGCFRDEWVGLKRIRGRLAVVCSLVCHSRMLLE